MSRSRSAEPPLTTAASGLRRGGSESGGEIFLRQETIMPPHKIDTVVKTAKFAQHKIISGSVSGKLYAFSPRLWLTTTAWGDSLARWLGIDGVVLLLHSLVLTQRR